MSTPTDIAQTGPAAWGTSLIRTYFPLGLGAFLAWLAARGFGVDPESQTHLITGITTLGAAVWYGLLRLVEPHLPPAVRALLFWSTKMPTYAPLVVESRIVTDPDTGRPTQVYTVTDLPPGAKVITRH